MVVSDQFPGEGARFLTQMAHHIPLIDPSISITWLEMLPDARWLDLAFAVERLLM